MMMIIGRVFTRRRWLLNEDVKWHS